MSETETSAGPFAEPTGSTSGIDADALMSTIESGGQVTPSTQTPSAPTPEAAQTPQTPQELAFTWNGKEIKAPIDRITQYAQQGYDYAQKMQAFKAQQAEFEAQQAKISELEARYKPVEEYVSQNPQWWDHVNQQYQQALQGAQNGDPQAIANAQALKQVLEPIQQKLSQTEQFIQSLQKEKADTARQQQDLALSTEIQSIRDEFKDLDWATVDAEGKNLEFKVLEHAAQTGITNFRAAFRDFNHDRLLKLAEERGKAAVVKERQKQTKLGLLGQSPTPKLGVTQADNIKNQSYDDLLRDGLAELGITG